MASRFIVHDGIEWIVFERAAQAPPGERPAVPHVLIFDARGLRVRLPSAKPLEALSDGDLGRMLEDHRGLR